MNVGLGQEYGAHGVLGPQGNAASLPAGRYQVTGTLVRFLNDDGTAGGQLSAPDDWALTTGAVVLGDDLPGDAAWSGVYYAEVQNSPLGSGYFPVQYLAPFEWGYATKREPGEAPAPAPTRPAPIAVAGAHWTSYALVGLAVAGVLVAAVAVAKPRRRRRA